MAPDIFDGLQLERKSVVCQHHQYYGVYIANYSTSSHWTQLTHKYYQQCEAVTNVNNQLIWINS